jgi:hypothetical protein
VDHFKWVSVSGSLVALGIGKGYPGPTARMDYTLYVDESGTFQGERQRLGVRVVVGVLLRGGPEVHRQPVHASIGNAFGWFCPPWHAAEITPARLAIRLRTIEPAHVPAELRGMREALAHVNAFALRAQAPGLEHSLRKAAERLQRNAWRAVGACCREFDGQVIVCAEHDHERASWQSTYPSMLVGTVQGALLHLALRGEAGSRIHVLAEDRTDKVTPDVATIEASVHKAWSRLGRGTAPPRLAGPVAFLAKGQHPGLVLADFLAHRIGPHGRADQAWPPGDCRSWNRRQLADRMRRFEAQLPVHVNDAVHVLPSLIDVLTGKTTAAEASTSLRGALSRLPEGVLAAALESGCETLQLCVEVGL